MSHDDSADADAAARNPSETPKAVNAFAGVDQRSPEGHLRSVLWDILGGMGAESVESAAQRVVHERNVAREVLRAKPWICDYEDCDQKPSEQCIAHTIENAQPLGQETFESVGPWTGKREQWTQKTAIDAIYALRALLVMAWTGGPTMVSDRIWREQVRVALDREEDPSVAESHEPTEQPSPENRAKAFMLAWGLLDHPDVTRMISHLAGMLRSPEPAMADAKFLALADAVEVTIDSLCAEYGGDDADAAIAERNLPRWFRRLYDAWDALDEPRTPQEPTR